MAFKKLFLWRNLKKKSKLITDANIILDKLQYKSRYYDARPFRDLVLLKLQFNEYLEEISFPVQVQRKRMPILTYGRNDFSNFHAFLNKKYVEILIKNHEKWKRIQRSSHNCNQGKEWNRSSGRNFLKSRDQRV